MPETAADQEWGSELSDDDAGAKEDAKDEDFRIEDEYNSSANNPKKDDMDQSTSDNYEGKRKRKFPNEEDTETCSISVQTSAPKLKRKPMKWSPSKEKFFPSTASPTIPCPSVVISPVSAEESLRATAAYPKPGPAKCSPDKILLNALEHALKKAKENASKEKEESTANTSVLSPSKTNLSSTNMGSSRKRVLVSPEGKTHEIKPSFHMVSSDALLAKSISTTLPSRPPVQKRTDLLTVVSSTGSTATATVGSHGVKATPNVMTSQIPSSLTPAMSSHQRPNILSRSKKTTVTSKAGSQTVTMAAGNQASKVLIPGTNMTGKVVQMIQKGNAPGVTNPSSQTKVIMTKDGVTKVFSKVLNPNLGTLKPTTASATTTAKTTIPTKPQGTQPVTSQTKILFIPAASVDAKSPLASFKPQTITTTNGQSIYGYAVVVPQGSSQDLSAVINSSLKKPMQSSVKQTINIVQGKPIVGATQGKPLAGGSQAKSIVINSQGKTSTVVSQGQLITTVAQGKSTFVVSQGKPMTATFQGKPLAQSLQIKATTSTVPGQSTVTIPQSKPTAVHIPVASLPGKTVIPNFQGKVTMAALQGNPISSSQGKSSVNILQGNTQGKPTTYILQGKPPSTLAMGKTASTVIQGKPAVHLVLGNQGAANLQGKTLTIAQGNLPTNAQGKPIVVAQGKPTISVLQGKPTDGKQTIIGNSNVAALLNSLRQLQPGISTIIQPGVTPEHQLVTATVAMTSQSQNPSTNIAGARTYQLSNSTATVAVPGLTSTATTVSGPGRLAPRSSTTHTIQSTSVTSTSAPITATSTVSPITGTLLNQANVITTASMAAMKNMNNISMYNTNQPTSSVQVPVPNSTVPNITHASQSVKLSLLQQARSRILAAAGGIQNQPSPLSTASHSSSHGSTNASQGPIVSAVAISQSTKSQPLSTSSNLVGTKSQSSVLLLPNQPHSDVLSSNNQPLSSVVSSNSQSHSGVVSTASPSVTINKPQSGVSLSTNQPQSGITKTIITTVNSSQPQSDGANVPGQANNASNSPSQNAKNILNSTVTKVLSVETVGSSSNSTSTVLVNSPNISTYCNGVLEHVAKDIAIFDTEKKTLNVHSSLPSSNISVVGDTLSSLSSKAILNPKNTNIVASLDSSDAISKDMNISNSKIVSLTCKSTLIDIAKDKESGMVCEKNSLSPNANSKDGSGSDNTTISSATKSSIDVISKDGSGSGNTTISSPNKSSIDVNSKNGKGSDNNTISSSTKSTLDVVSKDTSYAAMNAGASTALTSNGLHCAKDSNDETHPLGNSAQSSTVSSA